LGSHIPKEVFARKGFSPPFPLVGSGWAVYLSPMAQVKIAGRTFELPRSRLLRILIGVVFVLLGFMGFLPVLGFWMIPLGLIVLSIDIPAVRRWRRRLEVSVGQWLKANYPALAAKLGYRNVNGNGRRRPNHAGPAKAHAPSKIPRV